MKKWSTIFALISLLLSVLACNLAGEGTAAVEQKEGDSDSGSVPGPAVPAVPTQPAELSPNITTVPDVEGSPETPESTAPSGMETLPAPTATVSGLDRAPQPTIHYFRSNVEMADPGDTITLEWMTSGTISVTLWHMSPSGQFSRYWDVAPNGAFDYYIGFLERNSTRFALFATAGTDQSQMETLSVSLQCPDEWFFNNAPGVCPASAALSSEGAVQGFEGGVMIWIEEEDHIYVLFDDGDSPSWNRYVDQWDPGEPDRDPSLSAPGRLYQPVRGFGLVWREEPGVRERLGWAVVEETGYTSTVQRTSYAKYNETYILSPNGNIWKLLPERSSWEEIPSG